MFLSQCRVVRKRNGPAIWWPGRGGANYPHENGQRLLLSVGFAFGTPVWTRGVTLALLTSPSQRRLEKPSLGHRAGGSFRRCLIDPLDPDRRPGAMWDFTG